LKFKEGKDNTHGRKAGIMKENIEETIDCERMTFFVTLSPFVYLFKVTLKSNKEKL
jgi:hypothetical protein